VTLAPDLWANRGFRRLWAAQAVSGLGARVAREGLPMAAVISLKAGPAALGLFAALALGARAAGGFLAGPFVDRLPKAALMVGADLARAAVLIAAPILALAGRLTLVDVYVAGVVLGLCDVAFEMADHALLPSLVGGGELTLANARLATTDAVAEIAGPTLAGALFQVIAPPLALAANAAAYLASAVLLGGLPKSRPATEGRGGHPFHLEISRGLAVVLGHRLLRPLWLASVGRSFFGAFFAALYVLFAIGTLKLTPGLLGLTIAAGGVGGLVGALAAPWLSARLGPGRTIAAAGLVGGAALFLIPLAGGPVPAAMAMLALAQLFGDALQTAAGVAAVSLRQTLLAPAELGRAAGAFASAEAAAGVAGALTGGALAARLGPREALAVAAAGVLAAQVLVALSPRGRLGAKPSD
jgi:predicted MFS family arabinose efflux permease